MFENLFPVLGEVMTTGIVGGALGVGVAIVVANLARLTREAKSGSRVKARAFAA